MTVITLLLLAGAAAAVSLAAQPLVLRWAEHRRIIAVPNARSSHTRDTPVGGGLPIAVTTLVVAAGLSLSPEWSEPWWSGYLVGASLIVAVSWFDDLRGAGTMVRLAVQTIAAGIFAIAVLGKPGSLAASVAVAAAVIWIVGVANAYNFMDGIDGIAGGQAVIAGAAWMWIGVGIGHPLAAGIGAVLAGGALGFLPFNWPPARLFMGDVGAVLLGYSFAALTVVASATSGPAAAVASALCLWPFLFDAAFTMMRRLVRRENLLQAHRSHLYQRLVRAGCSHRQVTMSYITLAAVGVPLVGLVRFGSTAATVAAGATIAALAASLWAVTQAHERRIQTQLNQRGSARPT